MRQWPNEHFSARRRKSRLRLVPGNGPVGFAPGTRTRGPRVTSLTIALAGAVIGTILGLSWDGSLPIAAPADAPPAARLSAADAPPAERLSSADGFTCTVSSVTDGDTFRCRETGDDGRAIRVRLSGVAARERDGRCSPGHPCPAASAGAATAELRRLAGGERLICRDVGTTYGRIAAFCRREDGTDLSCAMVESGTAARWERYWGGHRCA